MTAKKGSLWKTSWNRARGTPVPDPVGLMRFFQDFESGANEAIYEAAINSTLGLTLPFWYGVVGIRDGGQRGRASPGFIADAGNTSMSSFFSGIAGGASYALSKDDLGPDVVSAGLAVVRDDGAGSFTVRAVLNNQVSQFVQGVGAFTPATTPIALLTDVLPGAIHGLAGGSAEPTLEEINDWFIGLRANLAIQAIPGKTSHLYSAASVVGVPAVLPNGGSAGAAEDLDYTVVSGAPTPANVNVLVRFDY